MRADSACNFSVGRRGCNANVVAAVRSGASQPQQFSLDAVANDKCAEFIDALGQRPNLDLPEASIAKKLAERVGFEPSVRINRTTAFEF